MQAVVAKIELATIPTRGMLQSEVYLSSLIRCAHALAPNTKQRLCFFSRCGRAALFLHASSRA